MPDPRPTRTSPYTQMIRETAASLGFIGANPQHIEAYMRLEHSTLDGLSADQFRREVKYAVECIQWAGVDEAESCARSFGLIAPRGD